MLLRSTVIAAITAVLVLASFVALRHGRESSASHNCAYGGGVQGQTYLKNQQIAVSLAHPSPSLQFRSWSFEAQAVDLLKRFASSVEP